jgi:hypothetical protein
MTATATVIAALVAGGMDAAQAAGLLARAAFEMAGSMTRKSSGATRQQRYRERNKASQSVTRDGDENRNETSQSVTSLRSGQASQTVTNRNESVTSDAAPDSPLTYLEDKKEDLAIKKESKKERVLKKRDAPLPDNWVPPSRAFPLAESLGVSVAAVESRFRDYLKANGKLYADYDAAFCNFIRNTPKFGGGNNVQSISNYRTDPAAGRATAREAQQVATVGSAALRYLKEGNAARSGGGSPSGANSAGLLDLRPGAKNAH